MTIPLRATIIPSDKFCSVDGVSFVGVDMTNVAADVHAVQWFGTWGEQEIFDRRTGRIYRNEKIQNLDTYQSVLSSYWEIRTAHDAAEREAINEQTIIEV
jgi:hypothetical protein